MQSATGNSWIQRSRQSVTRSYTWGLELVSETQLTAATPPASPWQTSWYGFDGHGSVRYLTSSTGTVTDTYDYDAFGNLINSTGNTANNYLFAGEQYDPDLGLYYNRARYLDVRSGRFWGMDSYEGRDEDPASLHKYLYVSASPVNKVDPSGHDGIEMVMAVAAIVLVIGAMAVSTGCSPRHEDIELVWRNHFNYYVDYPRYDKKTETQLTSGEIQQIRAAALMSLQLAFAGYVVHVGEGRPGSHTVYVEDGRYINRSGAEADGSTLADGLSTSSSVWYEALMEDAQWALGTADRASIVPALGNAIGITAAHELGHQFGLTMMHSAPSSGYYEGTGKGDATIFSQPQLQWTSQSQQELRQKLAP